MILHILRDVNVKQDIFLTFHIIFAGKDDYSVNYTFHLNLFRASRNSILDRPASSNVVPINIDFSCL